MKRTPTHVEVRQVYANHIQMSWLDWKIVSHQHFIAITEEIWEYSYLMFLFFGLNYNFRIIYLLKSGYVTN